MSRLFRSIGLLLLVGCLLGCGMSGDGAVRVVPPAPDAKETLQQIATSGNLKAVKQRLYEEIDGMREARPQQAEELMADFKQLSAEKDPAAIKAKAQEMADKL
ncbi:hypothetical protein [Blastopirellula marina]|uniref:Uncharacterized protein n=1 Tax=Blastopirellula marina DSM 3645 TaxID=314230 RepID=A3ZPU6_9BACT|nr:hypothetical protein [Blastopirellula marina]EAQ81219.1 hypothetical protein DSM3645_22546 [Blastopirellula marina DSM 3645]